ncbi:hypothetical protein NH340_JMT05286 [Sarcoptes scabiei]|uniref:Translocon-associated protein subunit alpha n=1 Tax=Sarcoptes scabiei TaxID=52283 RepID=A0A132A5Q7_SARSC|nr:translocon-associated protein subunit alpha-like protein [Sarcoptes scabiei]UXI19343.1 hypothetical protein NH340_JMT05286 [Sarcoptes scabiei]
MKILRNFWLLLFLGISFISVLEKANLFLVNAADEDTVEGEDSDSVKVDGNDVTKTSEDDEDTVEGYKSSPDADIIYMFTKPVGDGLELPIGKEVHFLVGFHNRGQKDFFVDTMDASFRYSADFSFSLQNFTSFAYNRVVKPKQEVTLSYQFFISEAYSPRPYGLTVNLHYRDAENNQFLSAVFNETVNIVELDETLNSETFFLFLVLAGLAILALFGIYQLFQSFGKKHIPMPSKPKYETGTINNENVDYDWLPKEMIKKLNKSPNPSKPNSPRQRRAKKE